MMASFNVQEIYWIWLVAEFEKSVLNLNLTGCCLSLCLVRPELPIHSRSQGVRFRRTALEEAQGLPESKYYQAFDFAHGIEVTNYYPETQMWILRNLTISEFVQGDRLFAAFHRSNRERGLHLEYPGFGEAIMCRIRLSTQGYALPCTGLNRGVWADHRLEIFPEKRHALHSSGSWKNVTSEILHELSVALGIPIQTKKEQEESIEH